MAGCTPILGVDAWDTAGITYAENFPTAKVIIDRIENVDPINAVGSRTVDLLLASPECTNHSPARGALPSSETSRQTALETVRWSRTLKPRWIIMENVVHIRSWDGYRQITNHLQQAGYKTKEIILNAVDFGVPQSRERLFLIADNVKTPPDIRPTVLERTTARSVLDPPETWQMRPLDTPTRAANTLIRAKQAFQALGHDSPFLLVYYGSNGGGGWQSLDVPLRTVTTLDRFALVEPANGGHQMRMLQPSELARAMGLPPEHIFNQGSRRDRIKLCGNGICAPVIQALIQQVIIPFV